MLTEENQKKKRKTVQGRYGILYDEEDYTIIREEEQRYSTDVADGEEYRICEVGIGDEITASDIEKLAKLERLRKLRLAHNSVIVSLPPTISKLQNIESIDLANSRNLTSLPKEIGDLINLKKICLGRAIRSLPSTIGKLQNLEVLDLCSTPKLEELPKEVGNLASLKILGLSSSGVMKRPLPEFLRKLKNITRLTLFAYRVMANLKQSFLSNKDLLLMLAKHCPGLCDIGIRYINLADFWYPNEDILPRYPEHVDVLGISGFESLRSLNHKLIHNRYRSRTEFVFCSNSQGLSSKLWPRLIASAELVFDIEYNDVEGYRCRERTHQLIPKPDAIYQLLLDGRDSFICLLLAR